ncbi:Smr/MutS family protein [Ferrovibrio sp.]|uniref:Smr/MutS family protein n=1 Tax=Ferrovibrio sp. TaxID=1917215 RepID=UPI003D13DCB6
MPPKKLGLKPQPLVPDGEAWGHVAKDVRPLKRGPDRVPAPLAPMPKVLRPEAPFPSDVTRAENLRKRPAKAAPPKQLPQMDGRLKQRLVQGRIPVEQRIDLHGLTLREAERAMDRLLRDCIARGQRGLLVITGKGLDKSAEPPPLFERRGVLRAWLPEYLRHGPWRDQILGIAPARQEQGGAGAFFVLLRRLRPER